MKPAEREARVEAIRQFNRFYTKQIGVLQEGLLDSPFSLAEVRVLYELAHRQLPSARDLASGLGLDAGYLSRILRGFQKRGLVSKKTSPTDSRQSQLSLTPLGRRTFAPLDARARKEIAILLNRLSAHEQAQLVDAAQKIQKLLDPSPRQHGQPPVPYILRPHQSGDMGWVVHRHGVLYAEEYGYDEQFEALVAEIVAKFIQHEDPKRERCWIAEREGEIAGSVFLVKKSQKVAKLRLLLVEPKARGLGIGGRLVGECVHFARQAGYEKIQLWTQSELHDARRLYKRAGFRLIHSEDHHSFSRDLTAETWELKL
jgi:DNA-binding MarR family transcriptional regulator/N-acetylglutamate synthase-like GNAT family acetyltransferase